MDKHENSIKTNIFSYDDYRIFLLDYLEEEQKIDKFSSKRSFAKKCGFKDHSSLLYILSGKRNTSEKSVNLLANGLALNKKETKYFSSMVEFTEATKSRDKEDIYKKMNQLRKKIIFHNIDRKQLSFYEFWYNAVIRELIISSDWDGDFKKLGNYVSPPIKEREAEKAFNLLKDMGLIVEKNGSYFPHARNLLPSTDIPILYLKQARNDLFLEAIKAVDRYTPEERYYYCVTMDVCNKNYNTIREITNRYFEQILEVSEVSPMSKKSRIYQLNFQLFPLSKEFPRC